jgi:hypothetical protein
MAVTVHSLQSAGRLLRSLQASKYLIDGFKNGLYVAPKMGKAFKYAGRREAGA